MKTIPCRENIRHSIKYSSGISSLQGSQQVTIFSCSEPEKFSPQPLTLLTEDSSAAFANQSLKATTSFLMLIRSSPGLSAVIKVIHTERTYLKFVSTSRFCLKSSK